MIKLGGSAVCDRGVLDAFDIREAPPLEGLLWAISRDVG